MRLNNLLKELFVVVFDVSVQLMAKLLIVGF